jgi:hypothetical protein
MHGLFPQHTTRKASVPFLTISNDQPAHTIDRAELTIAARSLKINTSPGPDGIPNEVLKVIMALNSDILTSV